MVSGPRELIMSTKRKPFVFMNIIDFAFFLFGPCPLCWLTVLWNVLWSDSSHKASNLNREQAPSRTIPLWISAACLKPGQCLLARTPPLPWPEFFPHASSTLPCSSAPVLLYLNHRYMCGLAFKQIANAQRIGTWSFSYISHSVTPFFLVLPCYGSKS